MEPESRLRPAVASRLTARSPPSKLEVPVTVDLSVPPESRIPAEEDKPAPEIPPPKVEVAVPETYRLVVEAEVKAVEEASNLPAGPTVKSPTTVEEALEIKPEA